MNLKKLTRIILLVAVLLLLSIVPVNAVVFNAAFDSDFYVNCYPDLKAAFGNDANAAYNHYLTYGIKEGRIASPVFDVKTYIRNYPDLQAAFGDNYEAAYNHFLTNGMNEGRIASDSFNVQVYIANYPDLQAAFGNDVAGAYNHYLNFGMAEGRVCGALDAGATAPEDHVHAYDELVRTISTATCQVDGEGIFKCSCGEEMRKEIPASPDYHDYQKIDSPVGAENIEIKKCTICGDVITKVITETACDHTYAEVSRVEATCTKAGKIVKQCSKCQEVTEEVIPMAEHTSSIPVGQGTIIKGVTQCTVDGEEEVTCDVCGVKFTRTISAHKFNEVISETKATCTAEGVKVTKCTVCGATNTETTKKVDHNYKSASRIEATCEKSGLELEVCAVCGDKKTKVLPAKGHAKPADTTDVKKYAKGYAEVDKKGNYVVSINETSKAIEGITSATKANCTHELLEAYVCENCKNLQVEVAERKTGHVMDTTIAAKQGTIEYETVDGKLVPVKKDGKIVVKEGAKADCQHDEVKVFTCANCKEEVVAVITKASAHTPLAGSTVVYGATCTEPGYKTYTCTACKQQIKEDTTEKALGHNYVYVPATCTEPAKIKCTHANCTVPADTDTQNKILADNKLTTLPGVLGHTLVGAAREDGKKYCQTCAKWVTPNPLSIVSVNKGVHQATTNPQANNITVSPIVGTTVTVMETADKITATKNPNGETKKFFCLVLDLGIAKDKVKVSAGDYKIEEDDLKCVDQWTTSSNGNQFLVWLSAEKCGPNGITITFSDEDNVKDPVDVTFKFVPYVAPSTPQA